LQPLPVECHSPWVACCVSVQIILHEISVLSGIFSRKTAAKFYISSETGWALVVVFVINFICHVTSVFELLKTVY